MGRGIPTHCRCGAPMGKHNVTGVCNECAYVARAERAAAIEAELQQQRDRRRKTAVDAAISLLDNDIRGEDHD